MVVALYALMANSPSNNHHSQSLHAQPTSDARALDVLFDVLADSRRRYALECLSESQTPMALADLADEVASRERERPVPDVPAEEVKQVYTSLCHVHIPKMADASIVEYTQERDMVVLTPESEHVEPFVEFATTDEQPATDSGGRVH